MELWSHERGLSKTRVAYPPSFYMHLKGPHAHWDMIESLESKYRVEECSFDTIFGSFEVHWIIAVKGVAEKIDIQTHYAAELHNVDVRQDQMYMAEHDIFPYGDKDEFRFCPDFDVPLSILGIEGPEIRTFQ
jgi:DNA polymerase I